MKVTDPKYLWAGAKKAAHAQGHGRDWAYVMAIFKRMTKNVVMEGGR